MKGDAICDICVNGKDLIKTRPEFVARCYQILKKNSGLCYVRFEVFTAVNMKNAVFWNIRTQFIPHSRHITSPLESSAG
jgi:hypothetical protein